MKILVGKPEGKRSLRKSSRKGYILKIDFKNIIVVCRMALPC
jgi:hypothetical protein